MGEHEAKANFFTKNYPYIEKKFMLTFFHQKIF